MVDHEIIAEVPRVDRWADRLVLQINKVIIQVPRVVLQMSRCVFFLEKQVLKMKRGASWQVQIVDRPKSDQTCTRWSKQSESLFAQANKSLAKDEKQ